MLYGHEDKINLFKKLADEDELAHSYLFYGPSGIGKLLFARSLAHYLEHGEFGTPKKSLVDSVIIKPEESSTGVGDLEEVKNFFLKKPFKSSNRLVIIDDSKKVTPHAQSSLLKFVEESPSHTTFVFIAQDPKNLLPPLQSRLTKIYFSKLSPKKVKQYLVDERGVSNKKAEEIAEKSFGRIGKAVNILKGQKEDNLEEEVEQKILNLFLEDKISNSQIISKLLKKEKEIKRFNLNPKLQRKAVNYIADK